MTKQVFWSTKSRLAEYDTVEFDHDDFAAPIRLVANQFEDVTLGGNLHTACRMDVTPPEQSTDPTATMTISFPRIVVGRQFKTALRQITDAGRMSAIAVTYRHWIGTDLTTPVIEHQLWVSSEAGVVFNSDIVSVKATELNPMRSDVSIMYNPDIWTGLQQL
jgi:hypothetical protein